MQPHEMRKSQVESTQGLERRKPLPAFLAAGGAIATTLLSIRLARRGRTEPPPRTRGQPSEWSRRLLPKKVLAGR